MVQTADDKPFGGELPPSQVSPRQLRISRIVAVAVIVVVYLASISPYWLPGNDSALYRLLGRSLAAGRGYSDPQWVSCLGNLRRGGFRVLAGGG